MTENEKYKNKNQFGGGEAFHDSGKEKLDYKDAKMYY